MGHIMNLLFFGLALSMLLAAFAFAALPFLQNGRDKSAGFAHWPVLVVLGCLGLGIALYAAVGKPELASAGSSVRDRATSPNRSATAESMSQKSKAGSIESLLSGLEQRLAENPEDGKGWLLLAKSYDHLGRAEAAQNAYAKASALGVTDAVLGEKLAGAHATGSAPVGAAIHGSVRLADDIVNDIGANAAVFITAKSADGSPMPLAVLRRSAADLPFEFTLDNSNSMVAGQGLASGNDVIITAKLSRSGDALLTNSDLVASTGVIDPASDEPVELVIRSSGRADDGHAEQ